ncbi:hypothetical protein TWF694_001828 [Orbilia ellipsospora]|uniref:Extracellular membrane protein CFEM domain-containing protein n=1 Tax=Orbilia ellipsospora TaxID=2528407 RepID=A0AAV9X3S5_9PEZI
MYIFALSLLLLLVSTTTSLTDDADEPQSIDHLPSYIALRGCAQSCFWSTAPGLFRSDLVASYLSCSQTNILSGALEACWCRSDYQTYVVDYLSTCVSNMCISSPGNFEVDIERATLLYRGYCESVVSKEMIVTDAAGGATATGIGTGIGINGPSSTVTSAAKTSPAASVPPVTSPPTVTTTGTTLPSSSSGVSPMGSNTGNGNTGGGLSPGQIIGISIGVCAVSITIWWGWRNRWFQRCVYLLGRIRRRPRVEGVVGGQEEEGIYTGDGVLVDVRPREV